MKSTILPVILKLALLGGAFCSMALAVTSATPNLGPSAPHSGWMFGLGSVVLALPARRRRNG